MNEDDRSEFGPLRLDSKEFARQQRNELPNGEAVLWNYLRRSALGYKFSRQVRIGSFFADFCCRSRKLVVEVDGHSHDLRQAYDARREDTLVALGYAVIRFTNEQIQNNLEWVLSEIRKACERRPQWRY